MRNKQVPELNEEKHLCDINELIISLTYLLRNINLFQTSKYQR